MIEILLTGLFIGLCMWAICSMSEPMLNQPRLELRTEKDMQGKETLHLK